MIYFGLRQRESPFETGQFMFREQNFCERELDPWIKKYTLASLRRVCQIRVIRRNDSVDKYIA
jgi:hypothetical protein